MKSRAAEVGHLVVIEASGREHIVREEELRLIALVRRLRELAACLPTTHRRARLNRESVQREMRRLELERARDIRRPRTLDTLGKSEDQIKRDVVDAARARSVD